MAFFLSLNLWFGNFQSIAISISIWNSIISTSHEMSMKSSLCINYRFTSFKNISIANAQCEPVQAMIITDHILYHTGDSFKFERYFCCTLYRHHDDHVLPSQISVTLSCDSSLSSIASGRSSRLHPVSIRSCCR